MATLSRGMNVLARAASHLYEQAARLSDHVWAAPRRFLEEVGLLARLLALSLVWTFRRPFRPRVFIHSMEFVGVQSLFIVGLTALFVGAVFGLQLVDGFRRFGAENQVGSVIGLALARELAPVFSALMISSRAGSAMATELGSMRVTQQIDALTTLSVNPVQYLISPRIVAGFVMCPAMALAFNVIGLAGAYGVCVHVLGLDGGIFVDRVRWYVDSDDLEQGLIKAAVFGMVLTLIACRQGYYASGGAAGVGRATNQAVVQSAVAILLLDYVLTALIVGQGLL